MVAITLFVSWHIYWFVPRFIWFIRNNRQEYLRRTGVRQYSFADRGFVWVER